MVLISLVVQTLDGTLCQHGGQKAPPCGPSLGRVSRLSCTALEWQGPSTRRN